MMSNFAWYFLSLKGRISRQEFWLGYCGLLIVLMFLEFNLESFFLFMRRPVGRPWYRDELDLTIMLAQAAAGLASAYPLTAIYVKRLHDLNLSGWWTLAVPVIAVASAMVGVKPGSIFLPIILLLIGFIPGTRGDNKFGSDPLGHPA
jgi:uncharacterized membrane protein YhaH (DUF805 family)